VAGAAVAAFMIVVLIVLVFALTGTSGNHNNTAASSIAAPTTTVAAAVSAKGKPCVAFADTLPKGAPAVPVQVGPPPKSLVKKDLKIGTGPVVPAGAKVEVNYIGVACSTGKIFDSSYGKQPITADLKQGVIAGWIKGVPGMRVGGRRLLGIPSADAYGPSSPAALIAPDEALWFVVDAVSLK
jgi:FKBP-type peptidyl-prolyl cis-trans isomerase